MYPAPSARRAAMPSPVFLGLLALTAAGGWLAWQEGHSSAMTRFGVFVFVFAGWIVSMCLHEFSHAMTAYLSGDRQVADEGYLTLNPLKYAHPVLSIALPLAFIAFGGIGLPGGAVYLHPHAFRTRWQRSLASAAGPLTNLLLALLLLRLAAGHESTPVFNSAGDAGLVFPPHAVFWTGVAFLGFLQMTAAILNLLPVPGLDGYGIIEPYLKPATQRALAPLRAWGMLLVFGLLMAQQINAWFFNAVYHVCFWIGTDPAMVYYGNNLVRFWGNTGLIG